MLHVINKSYGNNTVHYSPLLLIDNNTVYSSSKYCGSDNFRLISPSNPGDTLGVIQPPHTFWQACPHALAVGSGFFVDSSFSSSLMKGMKPPLYGWQGSPFVWVGVFHIREVHACSSLLLTWRGTYQFHSPSLLGLANCDPVW